MTTQRTRVRVQVGNSPEYRWADVVASCKVAGYVFLVHRADHDKTKFCATYAPLGIRAGGSHESIEDAVRRVVDDADRIPSAIASILAQWEAKHYPLLGPETGLVTDCWHWREACRFEDGTYQAVPEVRGVPGPFPSDHYVHLSVTKTETDFVAYTPSAEYGAKDRQVRLKFGKYLRRVWPELTDEQVQNAVIALRAKLALLGKPATLHFATDRATINDIFETKMYACDSSYESCMFNKFYEDEVRPYHVYADSPDVAVAYVLDEGNIVSRSVVSTKSRTWVRGYSVYQSDSTVCQVLSDLLAQAGYSQGDLLGSRLTYLGSDRLPYLDGACGVERVGNYWVVCNEGEGEYDANQTDGEGCEVSRSTCPNCERDEEDCVCSTCECCESRGPDGCEECSMCEECEGCMRHDGCTCSRCSECSEIIEPSSRYTTRCDCNRCGECNELENHCECARCCDCSELAAECTCEEAVEATGA